MAVQLSLQSVLSLVAVSHVTLFSCSPFLMRFEDIDQFALEWFISNVYPCFNPVCDNFTCKNMDANNTKNITTCLDLTLSSHDLTLQINYYISTMTMLISIIRRPCTGILLEDVWSEDGGQRPNVPALLLK